MNKNKVFIVSAFALGLLLGALMMWAINSSAEQPQLVETVVQEKIVTKKVTDTVVINKVIPRVENKAIEDSSLATANDSLTKSFMEKSDSLLPASKGKTEITVKSDDEQEELIIISEKLVAKRNIPVNLINSGQKLDPSDQLVPQGDRYAEVMVVEFWDSPLELTGYELSRNKLKLFGFNPNDNFILSHNPAEEELLVKVSSIELKLAKTNRFKSLHF